MIPHPLHLPYRIILGSQSPRRQQLLQGLDIPFEVQVKPTAEDFHPDMPFGDIPVYLAEKKSDEFEAELTADEGLLLITADTIVAIGNRILNKPSDEHEAYAMLSLLSGQMHTVVTGVCLRTARHKRSFAVHTQVYFRHLEEDEIRYYLRHYAPYDKAGAYGVQEWIGYIGMERIEGSYFNVMGLPVRELYEALRDFPTR